MGKIDEVTDSFDDELLGNEIFSEAGNNATSMDITNKNKSNDVIRKMVEKTRSVNECATDAFINEMYESCSRGEITIEERETKIEDYKYRNIFESFIDDSLNPTALESFDMICNGLYMKESTGEITVDKREELIQKARELYLL